jgi:hypothetical protein
MLFENCYSLSFPSDIKIINKNLVLINKEGRLYFFNGSGPIYSCTTDDKAGIRLAEGMFLDLKIALPSELARALGVNQSTVHRNRQKYQEGGVGAFKEKKVVRDAYKLKEDKCAHAQELLGSGRCQTATAKKIGVSEGAIRYAIKKGRLKGVTQEKKEMSLENLKGPSERSREDQSCSAGVGVKFTEERTLAREGQLEEAAPRFIAAEGVQNAGVLIALPALLFEGLLTIGQEVYGKLRNGFFGLQSVLLTLAFMGLLRIKNPEQLKEQAPGELGIVIGLDRVPEVKTLRRKLSEMGAKARDFSASLARHWVREAPEALGFLYVDGHVRPYHGRKHKLPETHVARRRLCMPATTDFWVNDGKAEPLFFVTSEANDSLLSMLKSEILPEVRKLVGKDRRVTLLFDREGWSPKSFQQWVKEEKFDVMTYRKGKYEPWAEECFIETEAEACGKSVKYKLGERSVQLQRGFWMREVRRLCDNGHQTSVMTSRQDLSMEEIAVRMFSRWSQENFFKYMRHEYGLDHLCTYDTELANPNREVPNPAVKAKKKELESIKTDLSKLKKEYGEEALNNKESRRRTMRGFKIANAKEGKRIRELETLCREIEAELKSLPKKMALKTLLKEEEIVELERERKVLTDTIKMLSYRAETSLLNLIQPIFARHDEEGRKFLKSLFQTPADIIPEEEEGRLVVRFHTMATPRANNTLRALCEAVNQEACLYPGTNLRLCFEFQ